MGTENLSREEQPSVLLEGQSKIKITKHNILRGVCVCVCVCTWEDRYTEGTENIQLHDSSHAVYVLQ